MDCVIDTNVLVYEMVEDSELHSAAAAALKKVTKRIIPTIVLEELVYALMQLGVTDSIIKKKLEELLNSEWNQIIPIVPMHMQGAMEVLARHKTSFRRFNDKVILSTAKTEQVPLITFDRELLAECKKEGVDTIP